MSAPAYRLVVMGETSRFDATLRQALSDAFHPFGLRFDEEIDLDVGGASVAARPGEARVVLFFGSPSVKNTPDPSYMPTDLVIPVVSAITRCSTELPRGVSGFNALAYSAGVKNEADMLAAAVLETLGLLPAKRRVFLSYRRNEATPAALQLHDALRARQFNVFLDTHEIRFGGQFQDALWHQLSDSDVLLMLDTKGYFESHWTEEEFGRASSMRLGILRIAFPDVAPAPVTTLTEMVLLANDQIGSDGRLSKEAVDDIGDALERFRARSVAARLDNMLGTLRLAVEKRGGNVGNPGPLKRVEVSLPRGEGDGTVELIVYPAVGVPTSDAVERIAKHAGADCALLYDGQSVLQSWIDHLDWFGVGIDRFRWVRADNPVPALEEMTR